MNVNELMSREPRTVRIGECLDAAARVLWEHDCGIVPVIDAANVLIGVLTDRDLCMAAYTQGRAIDQISVASVMARSVRTCRSDDSVATAVAAMQQAQVHRLPVVDVRGGLVGIISTNDLVRAAHSRPAAVDAGGVLRLLANIGAPRQSAKPTAAPTATKPISPSPTAPSPTAPSPTAPNTTAPSSPVAAAAEKVAVVSQLPPIATRAAAPRIEVSNSGKNKNKSKSKGRKA